MLELELGDDQIAMTMSYDEDKMCVRLEFLSSTPISAEDLLDMLDELVSKHLAKPEEIYEEGIVQQRVFNWLI